MRRTGRRWPAATGSAGTAAAGTRRPPGRPVTPRNPRAGRPGRAAPRRTSRGTACRTRHRRPARGTARSWRSTAIRPTAAGRPRAAYRDAGHDTIIKPKPLRPAVDGGFTLDDFTVDEEHGTVTCPAGQVRPMSKSRTVTFGAACAACPLRERCTTAKDGRSMTIHPHEGLLRAARAQARTQEFRQAYPTRSAIERVI